MANSQNLKSGAIQRPSEPQYKCIDGLTLSEQIGYIRPGRHLNTRRYAYMAASVTGQCLSTRPCGPVYDGDTVFFREAEASDLAHLQGGCLLAVAIKGHSSAGGMMIKELQRIDYARRLMFLKQYEPVRTKAYRFSDILRLYIVDDVQRRIEFV